MDGEAVDRFFVDLFVHSHETPPQRLVLDIDATDDPLHGHQEGRFFHGYYDCYCYLPLFIFCGKQVLCARLRRSNIDGAAGSVEELERIITQLREHWPEVEILVRGDSGFARERLMAWCEANGVDYVLGLARNRRLEAALEPALARVEDLCAASGEPERVYEEMRYQTRETWSRERRVIGKAQITDSGPNPRFVVTSLPIQTHDAQTVYETIYCARGEAENRIKGSDQQPYGFAGEPFEPNVQFYYNRARWLDIANGRFLGVDSFAGSNSDPLSLHKYLYAKASPSRYTDPTGRETLSSALAAGAIQGIVYGAALGGVVGGISGGIVGSEHGAVGAVRGFMEGLVGGAAAGELRVSGGKVDYVNPQSGTYRPSQTSLWIAEMILRHRGLWGSNSRRLPLPPPRF